MSNMALYSAMGGLTALKVGEAGSETTYTTIDKSQRYVLPGTSTQNIILEYDTTYDFEAVAIHGLNAFSTLVLTAYNGATPTAMGTITGSTYAAEARAKTNFNAMWEFAAETADKLIITNTATYGTSFVTVFAGKEIFAPTINFATGSQPINSPSLNFSKGSGSQYARTTNHFRRHTLDFDRMSDTDFRNLDFAKYSIGSDVCLYQSDTSSTHPEDWMLCNLVGSGQAWGNGRNNSQTIELQEAYRCE